MGQNSLELEGLGSAWNWARLVEGLGKVQPAGACLRILMLGESCKQLAELMDPPGLGQSPASSSLEE